nr:MAG TPA: hypothetical protein [Caudoviricetes sp.]
MPRLSPPINTVPCHLISNHCFAFQNLSTPKQIIAKHY